FKQTHQPSPWMNDYGQFVLMPVVGAPEFNEEKRASWFSHKAEEAKAYYYRAYLADYDVTTEIAPTSRAALFRITYPESDKSYLVVDAFDRGSYIKIIPEQNKIVGYTTRNSGGVPRDFKNYFVLQFDRPFTFTAAVDKGQLDKSSLSKKCEHAGAVIGFSTKRGEQVNVRVASSFISEEQAERNLQELGDMTIEQLCEQGKAEWNDVLGRIEVEDDSNVDNLRTFYSCLYRAVLFPRALYEIDAEGKPVHYGFYTKDGHTCPGYLFGDTGFWDTFRALFPLVNLVYPDMSQKMQEGWVNAFLESGFLPEWSSPGHRACMVGNNSASVVADAYLKGIRGYDIETLWKAVTHGANASLPRTTSGRARWQEYNKLGYVPYDSINESAARTLEYAFDDWSIYKLGKALGKPEKEIAIYAQHAMNYKNLFNPDFRLMCGKKANGEWVPGYNPLKWGDAFTEGNGWHYTWSVFHDIKGLIGLMGGRDGFIQMMDSVFNLPPIFDDSYYGGVIHEIREMQIMNMGNYAHGNQPIQHMIYLYNYAGQPWKAQYWVRRVMDQLYNANPDGYCGDEDNGQTSAWYVFSALGFYSVCPGADEYVLGTPYFKKVTVHLPSGNDIEINAPKCSSQNMFVRNMKYNGETYNLNYLKHSDLVKGATIEFGMSDKPNKQRGTSEEAAPYSFSNEYVAKGKK
ncbi:MAG: glycoside hydrolase family 92 protein, partial [Bacteroidaceae bacterium]|nr:glycoside hydrolase family 92 protein [Bacteroidaceae bacterium]